MCCSPKWSQSHEMQICQYVSQSSSSCLANLMTNEEILAGLLFRLGAGRCWFLRCRLDYWLIYELHHAFCTSLKSSTAIHGLYPCKWTNRANSENVSKKFLSATRQVHMYQGSQRWQGVEDYIYSPASSCTPRYLSKSTVRALWRFLTFFFFKIDTSIK